MARRCQSPFKNNRVFSQLTQVLARQGGLGLGSQARTPFDGPDDRLPLVAPSAARPHCAVQSKHRARAKRRRVAKASRRAEPQPGLSHSEAVASVKRKRQRTTGVMAWVDPATSRRMTGKRNDGPSRGFAARAACGANRHCYRELNLLSIQENKK